MDNRKRRDLGMAYISDDAVMEEQKRCRRLMQKLNSVDRSDYEEIKKIIKEMLVNRKMLLLILRFIVIMVLTLRQERTSLQIITVRL